METLERPYYRLNVYDYVNEFCGWEPIAELIKYAGDQRNETYVTKLIKTGGRAGEVLALTTDNFKVDKRRKILLVSGMKLEKRFKKVSQDPETKRWITQKIEAIRKPFPIPLEEPLTKEMIDYLADTPNGPLFASPYKTHDPLSVSWGYKFIRKLSDEIPRPLFNALGLNQPFIDKKTGKPISDTIHLWQHWFRSQRASQLKAEYDFTEADLMEFFGWLDYRTALHYSHLGATKLAEKMRAHF
jgi:integrase